MKKTILLWAVFSLVAHLSAQTLKVHCGQVAIAVPASEAGQMVYSDGGTVLTIMGNTFAVNEIDSITVARTEHKAATMQVRYAGNQAHVTVSGDVAPHMLITASGADVSVVADALLQSEVVYELSGTSADGSFFMEGEYKATLVLDNLTLTNTRGAAIDIQNGKRIKVQLPTGTTTTLTDGVGGTHKACFFVNGHPEFCGGGALVLTGNTKHAFASDEYTLIEPDFGSITVKKAVGDGMNIEQYFRMQGGSISISNVQGDGIDVKLTNDPTDEDNGYVFIEAGNIELQVAADDVKGIKCDNAMTITGGTITASVSGLGTKGISTGTDLVISQTGTTPTLVRMSVTGTTYMPGDADLESKCRGIKVKGNFTFNGGTIDIAATGVKAKAISVDGSYTYVSGSINCAVDANM
ncbi:MAG: carbohydrate-binding domain-containing protein [Bacteroidaceae bacterium]|nr:carbohydrate-binding domain-containing protein [Bacteroidaceae bacterium]